MSRDTDTTPLVAPLAQSQFLYACVVITYKVHLIRTYVMTALCRHDSVALSWRQRKASLSAFRPLSWTRNLTTGYRGGSLESRCFRLSGHPTEKTR